MKKITSLIKSILFYLVMAALMLHLVYSSLYADKMMRVLGYRNFVVLSPSMEPVINAGDMIVITRIDEEDIEKGDIITFKVYIEEFDEERFVTHYVADIYVNEAGQNVYQTQGYGKAIDDYDDWVDEDGELIEITYNDIEGSYFFRIPFVGYISVFLSNPINLVLLVVNGLVLYYTIRYIRRSGKQST